MIQQDKRKAAIVGCGMVGMSYAYALLNQGLCDELVLIDLDRKRAEAEAMDLNHGLAFSGGHMRIYCGSYRDCSDADLVAICAGAAQKPGETRMDLLQRNAAILESVLSALMESGFGGILLVTTNPVDVMARYAQACTGLPPHQVLGSGTALDSARLRYLLGRYFQVDPRSIHACVMGEHGDSEFVPWSQAMVASKSVLSLCRESGGRYSVEELETIGQQVRTAAYEIINGKSATYYGIGMVLARITRAIFGNENSILTVSALLQGEYSQTGPYAGVPCILNRQGLRRVLCLNLTPQELEQFAVSCATLEQSFCSLQR